MSDGGGHGDNSLGRLAQMEVSASNYVRIELYFHTAGADRGDGWARLETACAGGARGEWESKWVDPAQTVVLKTTTEFVAFERSR